VRIWHAHAQVLDLLARYLLASGTRTDDGLNLPTTESPVPSWPAGDDLALSSAQQATSVCPARRLLTDELSRRGIKRSDPALFAGMLISLRKVGTGRVRT